MLKNKTIMLAELLDILTLHNIQVSSRAQCCYLFLIRYIDDVVLCFRFHLHVYACIIFRAIRYYFRGLFFNLIKSRLLDFVLFLYISIMLKS